MASIEEIQNLFVCILGIRALGLFVANFEWKSKERDFKFDPDCVSFDWNSQNTYFNRNEKGVKQMMKFLNDRAFTPDDQEDAQKLRNDAYYLSIKYFLILLIVGIVTLFSWILFPLLSKDHGFPVSIHFPFDFEHHNAGLYYTVYALTSLATVIIACLNGFGVMLIRSLLIYLENEFKPLRHGTQEILAMNKKDIISHLTVIIERHNQLFDQFGILRDIVYIPLLFQLIFYIILLSFSAHEVSIQPTIFSIGFLARVFFLAYNTLEFFLYCKFCEGIKEKVSI